MHVLLVEDDRMIAAGLQTGLRQEGCTVDWTLDGAGAADALNGGEFDVVLLDLGLPRRDGMEVLRDLRRRGNATPVIIVTARDELQDRVLGLDAGADDYIVKPFDLDEVAARMRSVVRRAAGRSEPCIEHRGIILNPSAHTVEQHGVLVALSSREFAVLHALLRRPGTVLSRTQLEERVYGWKDEIGSNVIEVHVHGLRRKLGTDVIRTVRGVGYYVPKV